MNTALLRTTGFWLNLIATLAGLLLASGVVLSGSGVETVIGYLVSVIGVLGGHSMQLNAAATPPAA